MPLIQCPDCGREVSDSASACIHCGKPLKSGNPIVKSVLLWIKIMLGVAAVIVLLFANTLSTSFPTGILVALFVSFVAVTIFDIILRVKLNT